MLYFLVFAIFTNCAMFLNLLTSFLSVQQMVIPALQFVLAVLVSVYFVDTDLIVFRCGH